MSSILCAIYKRDGGVAAQVRVDAEDLDKLSRGCLRLGIKYPRININGTDMMLSHFIGGKPPKGMVKDHINNDTLDHRKANLRDATYGQNSQNRKKRLGRSKEYIGVFWHKRDKRWLSM